ncbi:MAG: T9SS type A sorting domain-containing protein [Bacteroidales bacterium]|nr:T9SS type A sorting domain-containing protein [Bacteroidales bacterium]
MAGHNFVILPGKRAEIKTYDKIRLTTGFNAQKGSIFKASKGNEGMFDTDCICTGAQQLPSKSGTLNKLEPSYEDVYELSQNSATENTLMISLFPVPTNNVLNILSNEDLIAVNIYSIDGVLVHMYESIDSHAQINTQQLSKGIYLLEAISENNKTIKKFVIDK